jgi:hypothetical protein
VPDARRNIVAAAKLVYGERWQSALALSSGLSQQLLSMIASKDPERQRGLTPAAQTAIVKAIRGDALRRAKQAARAIDLIDGIE